MGKGALPSSCDRLTLAEPRLAHAWGRVVHPSTYLTLADEAFMASFEVRWNEHVDFGTSRSHKKKKPAQQMEWRGRLEARKQTAATERPPAEDGQRPRAAAARADASKEGGSERPRPPAKRAKTQPSTSVLANKGRFTGTLAASLLSGGGGGGGGPPLQ